MILHFAHIIEGARPPNLLGSLSHQPALEYAQGTG